MVAPGRGLAGAITLPERVQRDGGTGGVVDRRAVQNLAQAAADKPIPEEAETEEAKISPPQRAAADKPEADAFPRPKQKPTPPINPDFLNKLFERESRGSGGYGAKTGTLPPTGTMRGGLALGKYQMQRGALIEAGYVDEKTKRWTGKGGVNSAEDFLKKPQAQETALREFLDVYWEQRLKGNGARAREGQTIDGVKDRFTITKAGLLAAAHREGAEGVKLYLNRLESLGWTSDERKFGDRAQTRSFLAIETRLREFSTVPFNK